MRRLPSPVKLDPRREQERADSRMIQEDHNAMANLSPVALHHEWPKNLEYPSPWYDNIVMRRIDEDTFYKRTGSI